MSELRNLLKNIRFGDLTGNQINDAGKIAYADVGAKQAIEQISDIRKAWSAVTVPSFGQYIPQTGAISAVTTDSTATLIEPSGNEIVKVMNIDVINNTLGSLTCQLTLTDGLTTVQLTAAETVGVGARKIFSLTNPIYIDSNVKLQATNSGEMTVHIYSSKVAI